MSRDESRSNPLSLELPTNKSRIGRAVDDELAFHIDERVREIIASGVDETTARAKAAAEFGDVEAAQRELRRIDELAARRSWLTELVADLWTDAKRTVRALGSRPGYAIIATLTLALGIGANSAMFSLVDRLLLSAPPHIRDAENVFHMRFEEAQQQSGRITWVGAPYVYYEALRQTRLGFDVAGTAALELPMRVNGGVRAGTIAAVTPGYFSFLGTQPALGRFLVDGDPGDARSVVLSHMVWARDFGSADDVAGREIKLGGDVFKVVGVAPRGFTGHEIEPVDAWIALGPTTPGMIRDWQRGPNFRTLSLVARPRPGVSRAAVVAEATQRYRALRADTRWADSTAVVKLGDLLPGHASHGGVTPESRVAVWLQGVSLLVLLIAVANVANLMLLRAIDRRRETAVCIALGVGRVRIVRHVVLESLLLGAVAALLAVLLARWAGPFLWRLLLPDGADVSAAPWRTGVVIAALTLGSVVVMTAIPAMLQLKTSTNDALRSGSRNASRRGTLAGDFLVVAQVACAIILLVGAGLFVRSLVRVANIDLGFDVDRVVAVSIGQGLARGDTAAVERFLLDAERKARGLPGVESTARSLTAPYRPSMGYQVFLPGHEQLPGVGQNGLGYPTFFAVAPEFFETMGVALLRGRGFATVDAADAPPVMIVDATMARTFWPNGDALGQCVRVGADTAPCMTVVGVVQDSRRGITESRHSLRYYLPLAQVPSPRPERFLFVRTSRSPESMVAAVRAAVVSASATPPLVEVFPMSQLLDPYTKPWRLGRAVFVAFGVLATVIATIGLYGVIAFGVTQRRRELGIRFALGASRMNVLRLVVLGAGSRMAIGGVVGVVGAWVLGRRLHDLLFQTSATDAVVFGAALTVVAAATVVACVVPSWRAVRVDPTVSLRSE